MADQFPWPEEDIARYTAHYTTDTITVDTWIQLYRQLPSDVIGSAAPPVCVPRNSR